MVDTAVLFAHGESFPNMQSNLSETPAEWNNPARARARAPGLNAAELRAEVVRRSLPHMVVGNEGGELEQASQVLGRPTKSQNTLL
jgi:hypothetical protein